MDRMTKVMKDVKQMVTKRINVRVGNYIYTVDIIPPMYKGDTWFARFMNPDIDNFKQDWPITKKDIIEFIKEEYPERV